MIAEPLVEHSMGAAAVDSDQNLFIIAAKMYGMLHLRKEETPLSEVMRTFAMTMRSVSKKNSEEDLRLTQGS